MTHQRDAVILKQSLKDIIPVFALEGAALVNRDYQTVLNADVNVPARVVFEFAVGVAFRDDDASLILDGRRNPAAFLLYLKEADSQILRIGAVGHESHHIHGTPHLGYAAEGLVRMLARENYGCPRFLRNSRQKCVYAHGIGIDKLGDVAGAEEERAVYSVGTGIEALSRRFGKTASHGLNKSIGD